MPPLRRCGHQQDMRVAELVDDIFELFLDRNDIEIQSSVAVSMAPWSLEDRHSDTRVVEKVAHSAYIVGRGQGRGDRSGFASQTLWAWGASPHPPTARIFASASLFLLPSRFKSMLRTSPSTHPLPSLPSLLLAGYHCRDHRRRHRVWPPRG